MTDDRRHIPRVPVFFVLERLSRTLQEKNEEGKGVVKNITPEGLLLESNVELNKNEILQLSFTLPHTNQSMHVEAKVRWSENNKAFTTAGLELLDLTSEQRELIMDYLLELGPSI
jgi:hypothetical protein